MHASTTAATERAAAQLAALLAIARTLTATLGEFTAEHGRSTDRTIAHAISTAASLTSAIGVYGGILANRRDELAGRIAEASERARLDEIAAQVAAEFAARPCPDCERDLARGPHHPKCATLAREEIAAAEAIATHAARHGYQTSDGAPAYA